MSRRFWTDPEIELLRQLYPDMPTRELANLLGRPLYSVYQKAAKYGLVKNADYLASHCRLQPGSEIGKATQFRKGHVPANKGLRRPGFAAGRMRETQFKPGNKPQTWRPIGSERILDGYLQRKVADTGCTRRDYQCVHRLIWEEANGPIPEHHVVVFRDGNRKNIVLSNLELISRSDLAKRNCMWSNFPRELAETIQLAGALKRKINRRSGHEKQD